MAAKKSTKKAKKSPQKTTTGRKTASARSPRSTSGMKKGGRYA